MSAAITLLYRFFPVWRQVFEQGATGRIDSILHYAESKLAKYYTVNSQYFGTLFENHNYYGLRMAHV